MQEAALVSRVPYLQRTEKASYRIMNCVAAKCDK